MDPKRTLKFMPMILVASISLWSVPAVSAEGDKNVGNFVCKDIMRASGENRDTAIGFIHGYLLGRSGSLTANSDKLATATDRFIEHCLDHPNDKAIDTMARFTK